MADTPTEFANIERSVWLTAMRALQSGDDKARNTAYTCLMAAAPPAWDALLNDDARHLDALAAALFDAGWSALPRYAESPPLLRVLHPTLPLLGDSVAITTSAEGVRWFRSSTGALLAPVAEVDRARDGVVAAFAPFVLVNEPT